MVNGFPPKMSTTTPAARVTHSHTMKAATAAVAGQAAVLQGNDLIRIDKILSQFYSSFLEWDSPLECCSQREDCKYQICSDFFEGIGNNRISNDFK